MLVQAQVLGADLKDGSLFDFFVAFFIVNPRDTFIEAFYFFDKKDSPSKRKAKKSTEEFIGADESDINERKPFKFNTLTGSRAGHDVRAQAQLLSENDDSFTITVSLTNKKSHFVNVTFKGTPPAWLLGDDKRPKPIFPGKLMLLRVKDLSPPRTF